MDLGLRPAGALDLPFVIAAERAEHARDFVTLWPGERRTRRVWLDVKSGNARARHLYSSMGFLEEGIQGDESLVLMSMLCEEWEARRRACENSAGAAVMP